MNTNVVNIYIIKQDIHINILPIAYILPIAGQTAGQNGLKLFVDTHGRPGGIIKKIQHFFLYF